MKRQIDKRQRKIEIWKKSNAEYKKLSVHGKAS